MFFGKIGSRLLLVRLPIQFGIDSEQPSVTVDTLVLLEIPSLYRITSQNCDALCEKLNKKLSYRLETGRQQRISL